MKSKTKKITAIVLTAAIAVTMVFMLAGCGQKWTCDNCDKTWTGDAYYGSDYSDVLCDECAQRYWNPLPYKEYKK